MPLDERERKELAKKILEQRRSMWKGQVSERRPKEQRSHESGQVPVPQQEQEESQQATGIDQPPRILKTREAESRKYQSRMPTLKLALLVIIGLISAIGIGILIGYLVAAYNLIEI